MSNRVFTDEAKPVRAKMGRPSKGDLTDAEFAAIAPALAMKRRARGGSLEAAARTISMMRGAGSAIDPRTVAGRTVSARWVSHQLAKRGFAGKSALRAKVQADPLWLASGQKSDVAEHPANRMNQGAEPSVNGEEKRTAPGNEARSPPASLQVSEPGGSA